MNPSNGQVNIASAYEVLKQICKSWGMRVIVWGGHWYFYQIRELDNINETTGSFLDKWNTPLDENSYRYNANGDVVSLSSSMGGKTYNRLNNYMYNLTHPGARTQKLQGGSYKFLPVLKEVKVNLIHEGYQNLFPGINFPAVTPGGPGGDPTNFTTILNSPFINSDQYKFTMSLVLEAESLVNAPVMAGGYQIRMNIYILAVLPGTTNITAAGQVLASLQYDPVTETVGWDTTPSFTSGDYGVVLNLFSQGGPYPGGQTSMIPFGMDYTFPGFRADPTSYVIVNYFDTAGLSANAPISGWNTYSGFPYGSDAIITFSNPVNTSILAPPSWSVGINNNYLSQIQPVSTNNATMNTIFLNSQDDDSHKLDWGDVFWGDGPEYWDDSALRIQTDLTTWEFSDWTSKNWKHRKNTDATLPSAGSGENFTALLCHEIKYAQGGIIQRANFKLADSPVETIVGGHPVQVNPVGNITDIYQSSELLDPNKRFFFRRGSFNMQTNEWNGEWVESTLQALSGGAYQAKIAGGTNLNGSGLLKLGVGASNLISNIPKVTVFASSEVVVKDVAITSIDITPVSDGAQLRIGTNFNLKTGDKLLMCYMDGNLFEITLTADVSPTSTSISFSSITPTIASLGLVTFQVPLMDVMEQSNRKTSGKIAGLDVTATTIDEATHVGREYLSIRCDANALPVATYYMFYGVDNNKSGRMNQVNTNAPTQITAQASLKSTRFYAEHSYEFESGKIAISATSGATIKIILYKATIAESSAKITMTEIGSATIVGAGNATPKIADFVIASASLSSGECIIPHVYCTSDEDTASFRGQITYTLIRK